MAFNGLPGLPQEIAAWLERRHESAPSPVAVPKFVDLLRDFGFIFWGPGLREQALPWRLTALFGDGRSDQGCLYRFVGLSDASDGEIAEFAQEWGVLGFCQKHRLPGAHVSCPPAIMTWQSDRPDLFAYWDRLEDWRSFASRLKALLSLTYAATEGEAPRRGDFETAVPAFAELDPTIREGLWQFGLTRGRSEIAAYAVSQLLCDTNFELGVEWDEGLRRFHLGFTMGRAVAEEGDAFAWPSNSLYWVLIHQLVSAVTAGEFALCARCTTPFYWEHTGIHTRFPRTDRNAYCSVWCRQEARREQKAAWKRRRNRRLREQPKGGTT